MKREIPLHSIQAMESAGYFIKDLIGAFLFLIISLLVVMFIMMPELTGASGEWISLSEGLLLMVFMVGFPIFLIIQAIAQYRKARNLEITGKLTKGEIIKKWVDLSEGKPIYRILYKYRKSIWALQVVSEKVFQKLNCDQNIDVLHLENAPHISRLKFN